MKAFKVQSTMELNLAFVDKLWRIAADNFVSPEIANKAMFNAEFLELAYAEYQGGTLNYFELQELYGDSRSAMSEIIVPNSDFIVQNEKGFDILVKVR